ncbi:MAG: hypothetical protein R2705_04015 [Ilumatobacteraceae bacterium]
MMARLEFLRDDVAQMEARRPSPGPPRGRGRRTPDPGHPPDGGLDGAASGVVRGRRSRRGQGRGSGCRLFADPTGEQVTPAADGDDQVGGGDAARDDTGQLPGGDPDATRALTVVDASGQPTGPSAPTPAGDTGDTRDTDVTAEVPIVE